MEPQKNQFPIQKSIVPDHKLMLISCDSSEEAHFIAAVLNSSVSQLIVMSYTIETTMDTHIVNHVYVPNFNPQDQTHVKLSELSKKAHELARRYYEQNDLDAQAELNGVEDEVDVRGADLYRISDEGLKEIKRSLLVLREGQPEEQEETDT